MRQGASDVKGETVFVVDDDPSVRRSVSRLLRSAGHAAESFSSAAEFLQSPSRAKPGCLILDVHLPDLNGLDLQQELEVRDECLPIVFITGLGDIPTSVRAMKGGAVDFLTKPFEARVLLAAVSEALATGRQARRDREEREALGERLSTLTARERQVFDRVAQGRLNKQIALELGTAEKTVKVHRGRVMQKLGAGSVADLVKIAGRLSRGDGAG